jgi:hypothetical protein
MRFDDRINGILLGLLALAIIVLARQIPAVPGTTFGPDLMPTLIGLGMAGAALRIFFLGLRSTTAGPWVDVSDWRGQTRGLVAAFWAIAGAILGILFLNQLGFPIFAVLYALPLMLLLGVRPLLSAIVSVVVALLAFLVFYRVLMVPLPVGPLLFLR